jgi:hypothetical protein
MDAITYLKMSKKQLAFEANREAQKKLSVGQHIYWEDKGDTIGHGVVTELYGSQYVIFRRIVNGKERERLQAECTHVYSEPPVPSVTTDTCVTTE